MKERAQRNIPARVRRQSLVTGMMLLFALLLFATPLRAAAPGHELVRWHFKSQSQLQDWVDHGLDVWEVKDGEALISISPNQKLALKAEGFELASVTTSAGAAFPACYRTYDDMLTFLDDREARYPDLIRWDNVGESWESQNGMANRYLYAARLTNTEGPAEKPKFFLVAEHHAREIITPDIAMHFIDDLLENYGDDPTITWLLDNREIWVMPMANPDGYARAVQVEDWRKNTDRTATCDESAPPNSYGVDLNRNYGYQWGLSPGSSADPCNLTYRGDGPFSEPETRAIRNLVDQERFDLIVSLHSYGNFVLYPWAHTWDPAPQADSLGALARRMVGDSGYAAIQATGIGYTSSGDLTDWTYGDLGIPSFTFEIGDLSDGGFWPSCSKKTELYQEVRPALIYASLAAGRPYQVAGGPDAREITVNVNAPSVSVRARVSDWWTGNDPLRSVELFVESVGGPGTGIAMTPSDGVCDSETEWMSADLDEGVFMRYAGRRVPLFVVAEDVKGERGVPSVAWLDLREYSVPASYGVRVWEANSAEPDYEIRSDFVYLGPAENDNVLLTLSGDHIYSGKGTTGELLYTLDNGRLRVGKRGPIVYTLQADQIYRGEPGSGSPLYRIAYDRVMAVDGPANEVVLTANANLSSDSMRTVCLILSVLMDGQF